MHNFTLSANLVCRPFSSPLLSFNVSSLQSLSHICNKPRPQIRFLAGRMQAVRVCTVQGTETTAQTASETTVDQAQSTDVVQTLLFGSVSDFFAAMRNWQLLIEPWHSSVAWLISEASSPKNALTSSTLLRATVPCHTSDTLRTPLPFTVRVRAKGVSERLC